jgi:hypothetical protein
LIEGLQHACFYTPDAEHRLAELSPRFTHIEPLPLSPPFGQSTVSLPTALHGTRWYPSLNSNPRLTHNFLADADMAPGVQHADDFGFSIDSFLTDDALLSTTHDRNDGDGDSIYGPDFFVDGSLLWDAPGNYDGT